MQSNKAALKFIEKCYKLYEQKMYHVAYNILHDAGLAEDAVQEAFLKLMKHNTYFEDAEADNCKRYIITVIKHASIDIYNKNKREREIMYFSDEEAALRKIPAPDDDEADIEELISSLPPKYYSVVYTLVIKNLSTKEAAKELGISESAVRKRFERAKLLLKTIHNRSEKFERKTLSNF